MEASAPVWGGRLLGQSLYAVGSGAPGPLIRFTGTAGLLEVIDPLVPSSMRSPFGRFGHLLHTTSSNAAMCATGSYPV